MCVTLSEHPMQHSMAALTQKHHDALANQPASCIVVCSNSCAAAFAMATELKLTACVLYRRLT